MGKLIKISAVSLGCPKNLADTESILGNLKNVELVNENDAEYIFLNTCAFLKSARDEVFENLKLLKDKKIILMGCMCGLIDESIFENFPQIKAVISSANYFKVGEIFNEILKDKRVFAVNDNPKVFEEINGKMLLTSGGFSYVKIAEGCDNKCSYCLIPKLKGKYRSRKMEEIIKECKNSIKMGVKELVLVAQDCGYYGYDLYKKFALPKLLKKISQIKGDFWVRVLYIYPERVSPDLINVMKESEKICKYLDIPLQHGDAEILQKMRRTANKDRILEKIKYLRGEIPNIYLRSSFITGFPGENKKAFLNLKNFLKEINFDHVGVFEYSREEGTEAFSMPSQISNQIKKKRRDELMFLQQKISKQKNQNLKGKIMKTLIEGFDKKSKLYFGRIEKFAPEIDGQIFIKSKKALEVNKFYDVKIISGSAYDLGGVI
ncbi:ribosomal protein S12 methylthiotransferase RimO [Candidatus Peregrinibacteria bacterium RIFOXYC2_FULL_33_13]|nr:MAG: ribosomal protein S12 methylthiotransferase RimO [Candidatus Peregrinibacteria bacterium RIFOXYC2_FULL_33_13]